MHRDHHRWYSHRLNRDMGVAVYGHYGMPILAFPTSMGDEWEQEGQGMIRHSARTSTRGESASSASTACRAIRSPTRARTPSIAAGCRRNTTPMWRTKSSPSSTPCAGPRHPDRYLGASLGAYHAANTLFKHPDHVKRCYALSGVYDMRDSMDGMYNDNFYFNNPVDYMANQNTHGFSTSTRVAISS